MPILKWNGSRRGTGLISHRREGGTTGGIWRCVSHRGIRNQRRYVTDRR